jgi:hypothetical protein
VFIILGGTLPVLGLTWQALISPASLDAIPLHLNPGYTNGINFVLRADSALYAGTNPEVVLQLDMPVAFGFVETAGVYQLHNVTEFVENGRRKVECRFIIPWYMISGQPNDPMGEVNPAKNQNFFITVPQGYTVDASSFVQMRLWHLHNGNWVFYDVLPQKNIAIDAIAPTVQPSRVRIGLWDYGFHTANAAASGFSQLLAATGVNHIQMQISSGFAQNGITAGGEVHNSFFDNVAYHDYDVDGNPISGDCCDPQAVIDLGASVVQVGINEMVAQADACGGYTTVDYEPIPLTGWSTRSLTAFKQRMGVTDGEVNSLRAYVQTNKWEAWRTTDPVLQPLYRKWIDFRIWQTTEFFRIVSEAFKTQRPNATLEVCPNRSFSDDDIQTLAQGYNAARFAKYAEVISPQLYANFDTPADIKHVLLYAREWRKRVDLEKRTTQVCPLVQVRHDADGPVVTPGHVRQQMVGVIAEGMEGVSLYYPQGMDGRYWQDVANASLQINYYDNKYYAHRYNRADVYADDVLFIPKNMPAGSQSVYDFPSVEYVIQNPDWHYTAHYNGSDYLLTLFNFRPSENVTFQFDYGLPDVQWETITTSGATPTSNGWTVGPQGYGFVQLSAKNMIRVEAEDFTSRQDTANGEGWRIVDGRVKSGELGDGEWAGSDSGKYAHASGGKYLQANVPDGGGGPVDGPTADYQVCFPKAGVYRVYLRWDAEDFGSDSVYVSMPQLTNAFGSQAAYYFVGNNSRDRDFSTSSWYGMGLYEGVGDSTAIQWKIPVAGTYTFRVDMREDHAAIDAFAFVRQEGIEIVPFQEGLNGYVGTADTMIEGDGSYWGCVYNYGASKKIWCRGTPGSGGFEEAVLIRFDDIFSAGGIDVSQSSQISRAMLKLYCTGDYTEGYTYGQTVQAMTTSWIAGNKNGTDGTNGEVTYGFRGFNYPYGALSFWGNMNRQEEGPVVGTDTEGYNYWPDLQPVVGQWWNVDVTTLVRKWARSYTGENAGLANKGMYIYVTNQKWLGAEFATSENDTAYLRPMLVIEYSQDINASTAIPGDANGDGKVDVGDLGILAANYGRNLQVEGVASAEWWGNGDFNNDGLVDVGDLGILAAHYSQGNANPASVDFSGDYAKAFGTTMANGTTDEAETGSTVCSGLGLTLVAGLTLMGLMLVKLEE